MVRSKSSAHRTLQKNLSRRVPSHRFSVGQTPSPELSLEAMRIGVRDILRKPIDRAELQNTLTRIIHDAIPAPAPTPLGKLFVVMGTKGGVGASTIAVNLGVQLAQIPGKRTILVDFSRPDRKSTRLNSSHANIS